MGELISVERVAGVLKPHLPVYGVKPPTYQTVMLDTLRGMWNPAHLRVLDVGGGTGVIAQAVKDLFPVDQVVSVDVADRYLKSLTIPTRSYDGGRLPFDDGAFDAAMMNNVLHHVPLEARVGLLRECRRVAPGGLYIKDHLAGSALDHMRLGVLDWIGNIPFGGMVSARYLSAADWEALAQGAGYHIEARRSDRYRSAAMATAFPNRLEVSMFWRPTTD